MLSSPKFTERIVSGNANYLSYISDRSDPRFGGCIGAVITAFYRCVHAGLLAYDTRHAKAKLSNPSAVANDPHGRFLTCAISPIRMLHGGSAGNDFVLHSAVRILLGSDHAHHGRLFVGDGWDPWFTLGKYRGAPVDARRCRDGVRAADPYSPFATA